MTEVPVHVASGLSPEQIKAYRIADNQTSTLSTWDDDKLTQELMDLQKQGYDLDLTGFDDDRVQEILHGGIEQPSDPDAVPEPPDKAITQPGDLWILGDHRLLCGDSSKPEDVDRLVDGNTMQLINTDPPYNVKVEPEATMPSQQA